MTTDHRAAAVRRTPPGATALLALAAAAALAGCSSSGGSGVVLPKAAPSAASAASAAAPAASDTVAPTTAAGAAPAAGSRPSDPCSLLTDDQVTQAMGAAVPLLAEGASTEKPYSCTWGSRTAFVDVSAVDPTGYAADTGSPDLTRTPLSGIGDSALLVESTDGSGNPEVVFTVAGRPYSVSATADRSETDSSNTGKEAAAEQQLAALAAKALAG